MEVHCRTNLDNTEHEVWPKVLPVRPMIGDLIRSDTKYGVFQLELEVVQTTWVNSSPLWGPPQWKLEVELHIPKHGQPRSISEWEKWYAKARGKN